MHMIVNVTIFRSKDVVLINFALSKHLVRKDEPLTDQCGSLAYVSPDVLSGKFRFVILLHNVMLILKDF